LEGTDNFAKVAFCSILAFAAVVDAVAAVVFYNRAKNKYVNSVKIEGVVSSLKRERGRNGETIYPVLKFEIGGKEYETRNSYGRTPWNIMPGTKVEIICDKDDPNKAEIENKLMRYMFPLMAGAGAVMAIAMSVLMWFIL